MTKIMENMVPSMNDIANMVFQQRGADSFLFDFYAMRNKCFSTYIRSAEYLFKYYYHTIINQYHPSLDTHKL